MRLSQRGYDWLSRNEGTDIIHKGQKHFNRDMLSLEGFIAWFLSFISLVPGGSQGGERKRGATVCVAVQYCDTIHSHCSCASWLINVDEWFSYMDVHISGLELKSHYNFAFINSTVLCFSFWNLYEYMHRTPTLGEFRNAVFFFVCKNLDHSTKQNDLARE